MTVNEFKTERTDLDLIKEARQIGCNDELVQRLADRIEQCARSTVVEERPEHDRFRSYGLELDMPLDEGIAEAVHILRRAGIETIESCEGGEGHPFDAPTIRIAGGHGEGFRAYGVAVRAGLHPRSLSRIWTVDDGELTGPYWDLVFRDVDA